MKQSLFGRKTEMSVTVAEFEILVSDQVPRSVHDKTPIRHWLTKHEKMLEKGVVELGVEYIDPLFRLYHKYWKVQCDLTYEGMQELVRAVDYSRKTFQTLDLLAECEGAQILME